VFHGSLGSCLGGCLGGKGSALPGTLKAVGPCCRPSNGVAVDIADGDHGIVKGGLDVGYATFYIFTLSALGAGCLSSQVAFLPSLFFAPYTDGSLGALAGPGIVLGVLAPNGKTPAVAKTAVASDFHQTLDVHGYFPTQVALDLEVLVQGFPEFADFILGQISDPGVRIDAGHFQHLLGQCRAYAINICQGSLNTFFPWQIDAGYTCQMLYTSCLSLFLFVFGVFTNNHYLAFAADDLTLFANRFH
jgi:hypothetical protein